MVGGINSTPVYLVQNPIIQAASSGNLGPMISERFSTIVNQLSNVRDRIMGVEMRVSQILGQFSPVYSMLDVIKNKVDEIRVELLP
ncbi:MAG: hypothetical protein LBH06_05495 [Rikenellaceae bacterium]|nr:hypothetical protein [Rikenellaceae bacterium]